MFCSNCGSELAEGAAFCSGCGNPVAASQVQGLAESADPSVQEFAFVDACITELEKLLSGNGISYSIQEWTNDREIVVETNEYEVSIRRGSINESLGDNHPLTPEAVLFKAFLSESKEHASASYADYTIVENPDGSRAIDTESLLYIHTILDAFPANSHARFSFRNCRLDVQSAVIAPMTLDPQAVAAMLYGSFWMVVRGFDQFAWFIDNYKTKPLDERLKSLVRISLL